MTIPSGDNDQGVNNKVTTFLNSVSDFHKYPILSVWLIVFTFLLMIVDTWSAYALRDALSLHPFALFEFDLNRLSFYPLLHLGLIHWGLNVVSLFPLMSEFEKKNGTVHTGVTLNLLAVVSGLQYCIFGSFLFPGSKVVGLSGFVFSFVTYYAFKEHSFNPEHVVRVGGRQVRIKTIYIPFILLIVTFILVPSSSFWGHLTAISAGYCLSKPEFQKLYPPSKVILYIESKISFIIEKLAHFGVFYTEVNAIESREISYIPMFTTDGDISASV